MTQPDRLLILITRAYTINGLIREQVKEATETVGLDAAIEYCTALRSDIKNLQKSLESKVKDNNEP
jgi:hypothetical protein